jgi:hypothetical protein
MKRVAFALKWATRCCSLFPPSSTLRIDEFDALLGILCRGKVSSAAATK